MKKIRAWLWKVITAPFRWLGRALHALALRSPLREFFTPVDEDTPILDTISRAAQQPGDFLSGIISHLDALRKHLLRAVLALILTSSLAFVFMNQILDWLAAPIGGIQSLQAIEVTEPVSVVMRVALLVGFSTSLPYVVFEFLRFMAPGLSMRARWFGLLAIPVVTIFFLGGMAFTYYYMLDPALDVLLNFFGITTVARPASYTKFVTGLMFWIGICFEFPIVSYVLAAMGLLKARLLRENWRLAFILLTVLAAMITPTVDPLNMMIVLLPLWALYGLSILMAAIGGLGHTRRQQRLGMPEPQP